MEKLDSQQVWERIRNGASPSEFGLKVLADSDLDPTPAKSVQSTPDLSDLDADSADFVRRVLGERQRYEERLLGMGWARDGKGSWLAPAAVPDIAAATVAGELQRFDVATEKVRELDARHRETVLAELQRLAAVDVRAEYRRREALARELSRASQMRLLD